MTYPDSSSGSDVVTFAYNARSEQVWTKGQAGNVVQTDYDTAGRATQKRATTIISGFDDAVKRVVTAYVSAVLSDTGKVKEGVKYSSYGVPFSITPADFDGNGFVNGDDQDAFDAAYNGGAGAWDARVDLDLSGTLTSADDTLFTAEFGGGEAGGYRVLSRASVANRLGYAGYQHAPELAGTKWHVRHRVLDSEVGQWLCRDLVSDPKAGSLYAYVRNMPITKFDPKGLWDLDIQGISHTLGRSVKDTNSLQHKVIFKFSVTPDAEICPLQIPMVEQDTSWVVQYVRRFGDASDCHLPGNRVPLAAGYEGSDHIFGAVSVDALAEVWCEFDLIGFPNPPWRWKKGVQPFDAWTDHGTWDEVDWFGFARATSRSRITYWDGCVGKGANWAWGTAEPVASDVEWEKRLSW